MTKTELKELLDSLTLEEKAGQLTQVNYLYFEKDGMVTGDTNIHMPSRRFTPEEINNLGSIFNVFNRNTLIKIQDEHLKHNKIPLLFMADVEWGHFVFVPTALGQSATFDTELIEQISKEAAEQASLNGIKVTFSPQADLARDARWGRCEGSFGEDVHLNCEMVAAKVRGYQGKSIADKNTMAACVKHFAGYSIPLTGRDYDGADISERTLREVYLPPFKAGIDAGAKMMMSAFNAMGGVPAVFNKKLMRSILRDEFGFNGAMISDYSCLSGTHLNQGAVNNPEDVAKFGVEASVDIDMMDNYYTKYIPEMVRQGKLDEKLVDEAVMRVLELKNELGLFEDPYRYLSGGTFTLEDYKKSFDTAVKVVVEGAVLLKNDGILPLKSEDTVVIGPFNDAAPVTNYFKRLTAEDEDFLNAGIAMQRTLNIALGDVPYERGSSRLPYDSHFSANERETEPCFGNEEEYLNRAIELASKAKKVVLTIGEHRLLSGESRSRADLHLPETQLNLLRKIYEVNKNIVAVVHTGHPLILDEVAELSAAVLCVWHPRNAGNEGIAKLLLGEVSPSGRLPMSFPRSVGQMPLSYDYIKATLPVGSPNSDFTLRYTDVPNTAFYPFGYGLSYTEFEYSDIEASGDTLTDADVLKFAVNVKNVGNFDADEVVQLYIRDDAASMVARPVRQLKSFKRVHIKKGETARVEFTVNEEMLRFFNADLEYVSEAGSFTVFIGADSRATKQAKFVLKK